jgi:hypothetical protein
VRRPCSTGSSDWARCLHPRRLFRAGSRKPLSELVVDGADAGGQLAPSVGPTPLRPIDGYTDDGAIIDLRAGSKRRLCSLSRRRNGPGEPFRAPPLLWRCCVNSGRCSQPRSCGRGNQWQEFGAGAHHGAGSSGRPAESVAVIELATESAGVEHVGVPTLRHSAAVTWLESGVHQGRRRPARALVNLHHGRRLRPHQRRNGALGSRRVERGPRVMTAPHSD